MKIVVANSVGVDADGYHMVHVPSRWSLGVKNFTNCGYYPWELAYTSSLLKRETLHEVKMLDGVLHGWDFDTYFSRLTEEEPDWLIMESSSRTIAEDLRLAQAAKKDLGTRLIFVGQHPMAEPEEVLQVADHVCIGEYEYAALDLIRGKDPKQIPGVFPNARGELLDVDCLPFPEDDDVRRLDYHEPNCRYRQIQMYASRGCPRRCNFCAAATLYYDELNWRPRSVYSVVDEIAGLKKKYPEMEGVFFDEEVHNIKRSFNINLARAIRAAGLDHLKYEAMCEYASLDKEALDEMAKAGYYKIRVGIETGSDLVAKKMTLGKKHDLDKLKTMLTYGKGLGMLFYGTISVGGLGSNEDEDGKTVDLVHELSHRGLLDEVQVSVNTPQPGTDFYHQAREQALLAPDLQWADYDGNGHVVIDYPHYSAKKIRKKFDDALAAFDQGKERTRSAAFLEKARRSFGQFPKQSRVLVLRSARSWMIHLILEALADLRGIHADLLGQDQATVDFQPKVNHYYTYGDGFFSADALPLGISGQLRNNAYDFALLPMANNHLAGYQNVIEVACMAQPKSIFGIYPDGEVRFLNQR
ncbi:MAG: radical SAM protein [Nitrospinota bacterium]|nr:radical SAM protein [Nitrospinota bacterium]